MKGKTEFYFKKPVGKHFQFTMVTQAKYPILFSFIANNLNQILADTEKFLKKEAQFPCYYASKEPFEKMMKQLGIVANRVIICYEIPDQEMFEINLKRNDDKIIPRPKS
jgi:hypothetical protein